MQAQLIRCIFFQVVHINKLFISKTFVINFPPVSQHYSGLDQRRSPVTEEGSSERSVGRRIALHCASAAVLHRALCLSRQCVRQVCYSTALCARSRSRAGDSRPLTPDGDSGASEHTGSSVRLLITPLLSPSRHLSHSSAFLADKSCF